MTTALAPARRLRNLVGRHPLVAFFVLAYGLSWSAWLPYVLSENGLGVWPIRYPGGFPTGGLLAIGPGAYLGPAGAAVAVTLLADARPGLRIWWRRLIRWRVAPRWYAFALLGYPVVVFVAMLVMADGEVRPPTATALMLLLPGLAIQALTSGLAEEPGWRDFAQPRIQEHLGPLGGNTVLGLLWAGWHLPLFLTDWAPAGSGLVPVAGFMFGGVAFSMVIAWAFNGSGQSLPISILLHAGSNNVPTMLSPSMLPGHQPHAGFVSPTLSAASVTALVLIVVTRGRLGYRAPSPLTTVPGAGMPSTAE